MSNRQNKRTVLIALFALVFLFTGCASQMTVWKGYYYPLELKYVKSPDDIDRVMKGKGVKTLAEIEAAKGKAASDYSTAGKRAMLALNASYSGLQYGKDLFSLPATVPSRNLSTEFFTVIDLLKFADDVQQKKNTIYRKIKFSAPVEIEKIREKGYTSILSAKVSRERLAELRQKETVCAWRTEYWPVHKRGIKVYRTRGNAAGGSIDFSVTGDETIVALRYPEAAEEIPQDNPCSLKDAEGFLTEIAAAIAQ